YFFKGWSFHLRLSINTLRIPANMKPLHAGEATGKREATEHEEGTEKPHVRHHEHHKAITMADLAKAAGVSQGAISSLLNDRDYGIRVSDKTRERVLKVCREMGYIPNDLRAVVRMYPELGDACLLIPTSIAGGLADAVVARIAGAAMAAVSEPARA